MSAASAVFDLAGGARPARSTPSLSRVNARSSTREAPPDSARGRRGARRNVSESNRKRAPHDGGEAYAASVTSLAHAEKNLNISSGFHTHAGGPKEKMRDTFVPRISWAYALVLLEHPVMACPAEA